MHREEVIKCEVCEKEILKKDLDAPQSARVMKDENDKKAHMHCALRDNYFGETKRWS